MKLKYQNLDSLLHQRRNVIFRNKLISSLFFRELRLTYHFCHSTYEEQLIVKKVSTFTPKTNENQELETTCKVLSEIKLTEEKSRFECVSPFCGVGALKVKKWIKFSSDEN